MKFSKEDLIVIALCLPGGALAVAVVLLYLFHTYHIHS